MQKNQDGRIIFVRKISSNWLHLITYLPIGSVQSFSDKSSLSKNWLKKLHLDRLMKQRSVNIKVPTQGCQIFLGATCQSGENIPNDHKIYKMATKYTKWL
jgi:hypothetical protein